MPSSNKEIKDIGKREGTEFLNLDFSKGLLIFNEKITIVAYLKADRITNFIQI